jgi:hypothetical protein
MGALNRTQLMGDGMDFIKGDAAISVRLHTFTINGIRLWVKEKEKKELIEILSGENFEIYPGINVMANPSWPIVRMSYIAPDYLMKRVEFKQNITSRQLHVQDGDIITVGAPDSNISIIVQDIFNNRVKAVVNCDYQTDIRKRGVAFSPDLTVTLQSVYGRTNPTAQLRVLINKDYQLKQIYRL